MGKNEQQSYGGTIRNISVRTDGPKHIKGSEMRIEFPTGEKLVVKNGRATLTPPQASSTK